MGLVISVPPQELILHYTIHYTTNSTLTSGLQKEVRIKLELVYFIDDDTATVATTSAEARSRCDPEIIICFNCWDLLRIQLIVNNSQNSHHVINNIQGRGMQFLFTS